ncbi:MAG TPA: hypothetical protein VEA59_02070 [Patescibacteria group bacterium]|nr:hypothetical protein [Patescibacteria group bacterium]
MKLRSLFANIALLGACLLFLSASVNAQHFHRRNCYDTRVVVATGYPSIGVTVVSGPIVVQVSYGSWGTYIPVYYPPPVIYTSPRVTSGYYGYRNYSGLPPQYEYRRPKTVVTVNNRW